ncbi:MAG: hypothetical protein K0U08_03945 [Proteobacteria bacterium]|nr:hypothetical protein [Pseudomonadota bacterium]
MANEDEFKEMSKQIKRELSNRDLLDLIAEQNHEAIELKKQEVAILNRIDKRQALENHNGKKWTALTVLIMMAAFYVEIVKIDDLSILKDRAKSFIYDITDTYKLKGD